MSYCGHCGEPAETGDHVVCEKRLAMEPPRYCVHCRRRMKVQVTPRRWIATCVEHPSVGAPPAREAGGGA